MCHRYILLKALSTKQHSSFRHDIQIDCKWSFAELNLLVKAIVKTSDILLDLHVLQFHSCTFEEKGVGGSKTGSDIQAGEWRTTTFLCGGGP